MKTTIIIGSVSLGAGSEELGEKLMGSFLRKMCLQENKPDRIVFYNSGAKLPAQGSSVLDALDSLSRAGVDLVACGTCLGYYKIKDKLVAGRIGDMQEIAATLMNSDRVITV